MRSKCLERVTKFHYEKEVPGSGTGCRDPGSRRPVPDPETLSLGVRYRTRNQASEEWLGVRHLDINKKNTVCKLFWHLLTVKSVGNLFTDAILTGTLTLAIT